MTSLLTGVGLCDSGAGPWFKVAGQGVRMARGCGHRGGLWEGNQGEAGISEHAEIAKALGVSRRTVFRYLG